MATNTRFHTAIHALVLLARNADSVHSSESLAEKLQTNAVVIRRILAVLQQSGFVRSYKGPAGGSELLLPAAKITLGAVYRALEPARQTRESGSKALEIRRTTAELRQALTDAEASFLASLDKVTVQQLVKNTTRKKA